MASITLSGSEEIGNPSTRLKDCGRVRFGDCARTSSPLVSMWYLGFLILVAIFGPLLIPYRIRSRITIWSPRGPSWSHPMGTDQLGRDILARLVFGARVASPWASWFRLSLCHRCAAWRHGRYFGRAWDMVIMRVVDVLYAMPNLLFVVVIMTFLRGQLRSAVSRMAGWRQSPGWIRAPGGLIGVYIGLGLIGWLTVARIVRAGAMSLKEREFVEAARSAGAQDSRILMRHVLPNTLAPVVVASTLGIPGAILYEAGISFLGLGVIPPMPSWGLMIAEAIPNMRSHPYMLVFPAMTLSLTVLGVQLPW